MSKYHINKHGAPAVCRAKNGNCPLGGEDSHFSTQEEAQEYVDKINEQEHSLLPGVKENKRFGMDKAKFDNLRNKAVFMTYKNENGKEENLDGNVQSVNWEDNTIIVRNKDDFKDEREINLNDVSEFKGSKYNYFSKEHKQELRDRNRPQDIFRFSEEKLKKFEDKYVVVKYDDKKFDGKVIGSHYIDRNNSGLIIENEAGEVKHIKNYRMSYLDTTGDNFQEHEYIVELENIHDEFEKDAKAYAEGDPSALEEAEEDPRDKVIEYFNASVRKNAGEDVDLAKYDYDWTNEVEKNAEDYTTIDYGSYENTSGPDETFSEERYEEALSQAEEVNEYYEAKKAQIDDAVYTVKQVDWTKHGYTQKEGEKQALEDLMENGLFDD